MMSNAMSMMMCTLCLNVYEEIPFLHFWRLDKNNQVQNNFFRCKMSKRHHVARDICTVCIHVLEGPANEKFSNLSYEVETVIYRTLLFMYVLSAVSLHTHIKGLWLNRLLSTTTSLHQHDHDLMTTTTISKNESIDAANRLFLVGVWNRCIQRQLFGVPSSSTRTSERWANSNPRWALLKESSNGRMGWVQAQAVGWIFRQFVIFALVWNCTKAEWLWRFRLAKSITERIKVSFFSNVASLDLGA